MKINRLRVAFLGYFLFLSVLLGINNFSVGDLNSYFLFYFIQLVFLLEIVNFVFKRLSLAVNIRQAYLVLFGYTVINSLTLAFFPQWRDLIFNRLGHFISGVIYTLIAIEVIKVTLIRTKSRLTGSLVFWFVFSLASTVGVFNEIIELGLDIATGSHRIGPGFDTAIDLLMNTLGILTVLIIKSLKEVKKGKILKFFR